MSAKSTILATAAMAGLFAGASSLIGGCQHSANPGVQSSATDAAKHDCKGQNACKGQGSCKSDANACKGQNACKGKSVCKSS